MKFTKGHKFAKGGLRNPPGGRPTKEQQKIKKAAEAIVRKYLEKHLMEVLKTYLENAKGHWEKRWTEGKEPKEYEVWVVDAASTRHWIDKFVPAAKQEVGLDVAMHGTVNVFTNVDPDARRRKIAAGGRSKIADREQGQ